VPLSQAIKNLQNAPSARKRGKETEWSAAEDEKIVKLRTDNMKWADIANELPGRTSIGCRLRYQNYLFNRAAWTETSKNNLATTYEK
jgi:hypothetical protein